MFKNWSLFYHKNTQFVFRFYNAHSPNILNIQIKGGKKNKNCALIFQKDKINNALIIYILLNQALCNQQKPMKTKNLCKTYGTIILMNNLIY